MKRNLSGLYFRLGKENTCFEELPMEERERIINEKLNNGDVDWVMDLINKLCGTINDIGNAFDIETE